ISRSECNRLLSTIDFRLARCRQRFGKHHEDAFNVLQADFRSVSAISHRCTRHLNSRFFGSFSTSCHTIGGRWPQPPPTQQHHKSTTLRCPTSPSALSSPSAPPSCSCICSPAFSITAI